MKHHVEIFSADCPLCKETIHIVKNAECCKHSEITIHTCKGDTCCQPAKDYKIRTVPSIVIDGHLALEGRPTLQEIEKTLGRTCNT